MTKQERLNNLADTLSELETQLKWFEIDESKHEDNYRNMLDKISTVQIGSLEYCASTVLEKVDPIAYRCGLSDYVDSIDVSEDEDYQALEQEIEELQGEIDDLQEEIDEEEDL